MLLERAQDLMENKREERREREWAPNMNRNTRTVRWLVLHA